MSKFKRSFVAQMDQQDCGVAALASVAKFHGSIYSFARLRELSQTSDRGTTALGLVKAAESIGFSVKALKADASLFDMTDLTFPFIIHVNKKGRLQHYYIVYRVTKDSLLIGDPDPAVKLTKMTKEKLLSEWTGLALFLTPSDNYQVHKDKLGRLTSYLPIVIKEKKLLTFIIFTSFLVTGINIIGAYYLQLILDNYIPRLQLSLLETVSLGLILAYLTQQALTFVRDYLLVILRQKFSKHIILRYIKHVLSLPMTFFDTRKTGEITSRFTDASTIIDTLAAIMLSLFLDLSIVVIVGSFLLWQNQTLFLLSLLSLPIYLLIILSFVKPFEQLNQKTMQENALLSSAIIEDIKGIETIKALAQENLRYHKIAKQFSQYLNQSLTLSRLTILQTTLKQALKLLLSVVILWVGARLVMEKQITVGQLLAFNSLLVYFTDPLENIINLQTELQSAKVASKRLEEIYLVDTEKNKASSLPNVSLTGQISFNQVSYRYGFSKDILSQISFTIDAGEKVSLVGGSGSGKSTLAKLLVGFYTPYEGDISLNHIPIQQIDKQTLRQQIIYLPQDTYLFSGSIWDNLTAGLEKQRISQADIDRVCTICEIKTTIEQLPLGYQTELSERINLSGGQKQRLALARALLMDSPVLILDEATSGLDVATEQKVIQNLFALKDKTIVFIAHRLNIAENSHRIMVLDEGQIMETGSHHELMAKKGSYYQLFYPS